jgi:hypothetical protein
VQSWNGILRYQFRVPLAIWKRKILRRIQGPVKENGVWRNCTNERVDEPEERTRYYLSTQKRKMKMARTCGKNVRRKL